MDATLKIASWLKPGVPAGVHKLTFDAAVVADGPPIQPHLIAPSQSFFIEGGRIPMRLNAADFASIQPPPGSATVVGHIPHVALHDAGLPWMTGEMGGKGPVPWLAVVLFELTSENPEYAWLEGGGIGALLFKNKEVGAAMDELNFPAGVRDHLRRRLIDPNGDRPPVEIFEHAEYGGARQTLQIGRYDHSKLTIGNDRVSSVKVAPGYKATLHRHGGFSGDTVVLDKDTPSLDSSFNDQTSGVVVESQVYRDLLLLDYSLLRRQVPSPEYRPFLCHVRQGSGDPILDRDQDHTVAMVMASRYVHKLGKRWWAGVVDVRHLSEATLAESIWKKMDTGLTMLPVLYSWQFETATETTDFRPLMERAAQSCQMLPSSTRLADAAAAKRTVKYSGPLRGTRPDYKLDVNAPLPQSAEELIKTVGSTDTISMAAAFELGRLLAISRRDVLEALVAARAVHHDNRLKMSHLASFLGTQELSASALKERLERYAQELDRPFLLRGENLGLRGPKGPLPDDWTKKFAQQAKVDWRGLTGWSATKLLALEGFRDADGRIQGGSLIERFDLWEHNVATHSEFVDMGKLTASLDKLVGDQVLDLGRAGMKADWTKNRAAASFGPRKTDLAGSAPTTDFDPRK